MDLSFLLELELRVVKLPTGKCENYAFGASSSLGADSHSIFGASDFVISFNLFLVTAVREYPNDVFFCVFC